MCKGMEKMLISYVARILQKGQWLPVRLSKSSVFLENPTHGCSIKTEESAQLSRGSRNNLSITQGRGKIMDDQDLGFFANFLGIFIFVFVIAYHYVAADPKYSGS